jgi:ankyrin repeat protein
MLGGCATTDWQNARQANTIQEYERFLVKHPRNEYSANAKKKAEYLSWDKAKNENTIETYENFLMKYPRGEKESVARNELRNLQYQKEIQEALKSDSVEVVEDAYHKLNNKWVIFHRSVNKHNKRKFELERMLEDRLVMLRIKHYLDDLNSKNENKQTALMVASEKGHMDFVRALLDNGVDVNSKDKDGQTALIVTAKKGHLAVVKMLLLTRVLI